MHVSLNRVIERFPNVRERAQVQFGRDVDFQDLCEQYRECCDALDRLESRDDSATPLRNEYAALRLRLESELLRYLEEH